MSEQNKSFAAEPLDAERIGAMMENRLRISLFDTLDSTNSEARRQVERGMSTPALIIADSQSAGRGRLGRSFYSPAGTGLYISFLAEAKESFSETVALTTAAAVAVARTLEELCEISPEIKWVNDIYIGGRKACGILCESFCAANGKRFAVVGIGINLYTEVFPTELQNIAVSVSPERGLRNAFASNIADRLCEYWRSPSRGELIEYYRAHSMVIGKRITFIEGGVTQGAVAENVDELGCLSVRLNDGTVRKLSGGEISLRLDNT
ncbi:MAG: biotin--[acetyl-CoA-carboxylase] ligase [Clostridia bacterium]|nr:biotin--[acetyl-CoA-carboxylase] ligase [Clostridia bacterium]